MKILIIGGYSHGNPGDEAILKATAYQIQELFPHSTLGIWSGEPEFKIRFDRPVAYHMIHWQPLPWMHKQTFRSKVVIKLYTDFYPFSKKVVKWMNRFDKNMGDVIREYDKVVFIGGGYLNSDFCILEMNYIASLAFRLGKPIYLLAQTLGPFKKKQHQKMAWEIFNQADKIVLRDALSGAEVPDFQHKTRYAVDDALALEPRLGARDKAAVDKYFPESKSMKHFYLGINLREWGTSSLYHAQIAKAVKAFAHFFKDGRLKIIFIPMETDGTNDDRKEGVKFFKQLSPTLDAVMADELFSVEQRFYMIGRLDLLLGMRFHSLLFALSNAVPAIGLYQGEYYFRKISGLFRAFGLSGQVVPVDGTHGLEALIRAVATQREASKNSWREKKTDLVRDQRSGLEKIINEKMDESRKVSVVIATMNRAKDLRKALDSVLQQSYLPAEIILVDQSTDNATNELVTQMKTEHPALAGRFRYVYQEEKSLVQARNRGLALATGDFVSFLDDDIVLFKDYYEQVVRCFRMDSKVGAISGNTLVKEKLSGFKWEFRKMLMRFFLLSDFKGGMTASGFGYPIYEREIEKLTRVEFLPGCNMNFRKEVIKNEMFDEWFKGYSFREDSDFSYRMSKKTRILMVPEARLHHNFSTQNRLDAGTLKRMEMKNYYYIFKKYRGASSTPLFIFSLMGLVLIDFVEFLTSRKAIKFDKFRAGLASAMEIPL